MPELRDVAQHYPEAAHCDALYEVRDEAVGLHAFIALHDLSRGPGYGGIRRRHYPSARAAVREVVGLAEQMTLKTAFAGLPAGGAKAVILDRRQTRLEAVYESLGRAIESLGGSYFAGPDVGTSDLELASVRHTSRFVSHLAANPAQRTAAGVLAACREALAFLGATPRPSRLKAIVAGVGQVGSMVARGLAALGLDLVVSDLDASRAGLVADELGVGTVLAAEALSADGYLLAPCALGPIITAETLARFKVKVICGAANHQLGDEGLAHELAERQILYVPDFAINSGAVIEGVLRQVTPPGADPEPLIDAAIAAIGPRVRELLRIAEAAQVTPLEAALMQIQ